MSESLQASLQVAWPDYTTDEEDGFVELWELTLGDRAEHLYQHTNMNVESGESNPKSTP